MSTSAKLFDKSGAEALNLIRDPNVTNEVKLERLQSLKYAVKHAQIPEPSITPILNITILCLQQQNSVLSNAAFSLLSNVLKRLQLQEPHYIIIQAPRLIPLVLERFGDPKERNRDLARQNLTEIWRACPQEVEAAVRDNALPSKGVYIKQTSMTWIATTHQDHHLNFKAFVPKLMDALEDADGMVRDTAKVTVVDLFRSAPDHAKADLKKQLVNRQVRKTIANYILAKLELSTEPLPTKTGDRPDSSHNAPIRTDSHVVRPAHTAEEPALPKKAVDPATSQTIHTAKELESIVRDMLPFFEGKESEGNWLNREKSVIRLSSISQGNAPQDFSTTYNACIKTILDGILKAVDSLRTTVSSNACQLVQDIAAASGSGIDPIAEIMLQRLIKLCGGTKKISAANGDHSVNAILSNTSYSLRILQHILSACQDKNIQPRKYATGWVRTLLEKHGSHRAHIEHSGGAEILQKCVNRGLEDSDKDVRESSRRTYWKFALIWPDRASTIMGSLSANYRKLLENHPANPDPPKTTGVASSGAQQMSFSKSTTSLSSKPSLKEVMAAQKAAITKQRKLPSRPGSALSSFSPEKVPAPSISGGLNSKPVRPMKAARRVEVPRPATADPYSVRRKPGEFVSATPGTSRIRSKLPSPVSSPSKVNVQSKRFTSPAAPRPVTATGHPRADFSSPTRSHEDPNHAMSNIRPNSKGSISSGASLSTLANPQNDPLRVYEDATVPGDTTDSPRASKQNLHALHELTPSDPGHPNVPPSSARQFGSPELKKNLEQSKISPEIFLKTISSGTPRIAAGTLDLYGFRRIRTLLEQRLDFGPGDASFESLLNALLKLLDTPVKKPGSEQHPPGSTQRTAEEAENKKAYDLRLQSLYTIKDLQTSYPVKFSSQAENILCNLLRVHRHYDQRSHIGMPFQTVIGNLIKTLQPEPAISAILKLISDNPAGNPSTYVSVNCIKTLLNRLKQANATVDKGLLEGVARLIVRGLQSENPDVRRVVTGATNALHDHVGEDIWGMLEDAPEHARNMVAWSIAKGEPRQQTRY